MVTCMCPCYIKEHCKTRRPRNGDNISTSDGYHHRLQPSRREEKSPISKISPSSRSEARDLISTAERNLTTYLSFSKTAIISKCSQKVNFLFYFCVAFKITSMEAIKYKIIKSTGQYNDYCKQLEDLIFEKSSDQDTADAIELLTYLIEKWDSDHNSFADADPIQLLKGLMIEQNLKAKDLVEILGVSKGLVSDIINYRKGLSKDIIRSLSSFFKVSQEAFNRPYKLDVKRLHPV